MVAGGTDAAEGGGTGGAGDGLVPVDDTGTDPLEEVVPVRFVVTEQTGRETETGSVRLLDGHIEVVVANELQQRAEVLFIRQRTDRGHVDDARGDKAGARFQVLEGKQAFATEALQVGLRLDHAECGLLADHGAHERLLGGVIEADLDLADHLHQALDQGIAPLAALDKQTARAGAALAGGNEGGLHDGMNGAVDVAHIFHDQRVVATHLQCQDLARLAGKLLMQEVAGTGGAGEEEAVDVRIAGQRLAGVDLPLHQVEHPLGQPRLLPHLDHGFSHHGGQLGRLEHDRIAGDERRHNVAVGQVAREVVGAEHGHDAMGLVAHERLGARHGVFHRAGALVMGTDGDGNLALHGRHFGAGLPQGLAGFTGDGQGQRLLVLAEQVGIAAHDGKALFKGQIGPMVEGRAGRLDGRIHLGLACRLTTPDHLVFGRVDGFERLAFTGQPLAIDKLD